MTTRVRKSAEDRKIEIVDTAIKLAGDLGPDRLTTDRLAKEIGISQAAIFRHFPNKGEIWNAVGTRIRELMIANSKRVSHTNEEGDEMLVNQVIGQLEFIAKTPAIPAILFSRELHSENDQLREFFVGMMAKRHGLFSSLIGWEIEFGKYRKNLNPDDAAWLVLSLIQGLAMRWSLNARQFDLAKEGAVLMEILVIGFRNEN